MTQDAKLDDLVKRLTTGIYCQSCHEAAEAITALRAGDAGYVIVPREPTEAMLNAAKRLEWWPNYEGGNMEPPVLRHLYEAMIAAADTDGE